MKTRSLIENWEEDQPLVIFHGHSHYIGVLPIFKWLERDERERYIPEGERIIQLKPGEVYWVNPGSPQQWIGEVEDEKPHGANCAIYDPSEQTVILKTIPFSY